MLRAVGSGTVELQDLDGGRACALAVRAQPNARRAGVVGVWNACLKVAVTEPALDGRANARLLELLAELLGLARSRLALVSGERARTKRIRIEAPAALVRARLAEILA
jgi:uncharacterized protein (TIGR00251 family)